METDTDTDTCSVARCAELVAGNIDGKYYCRTHFYQYFKQAERPQRPIGMTDRQEDHLQSIKDEFVALVDTKFRAGAKEHGGDLLDLGNGRLIDHALEEAIDMVVYLLTLKSKSQWTALAANEGMEEDPIPLPEDEDEDESGVYDYDPTDDWDRERPEDRCPPRE